MLLIKVFAFAQQNCPVPPAIGELSHETDMFSDTQEVDLGDAMAEQLANHTQLIHDDALNHYLQTLGNRIVQQLPPNHMQFRFYLVELPEVNAFSITGGRVYVARKMVALTQSEDELAGVIAHELGHIVTHQSAIYVTRRFHEVLGVSSVGDRNDIFEKFHAYVENAARKPSRSEDANEDKEQYVADQVALYAMARAGYTPHAYVDLWDRFQQTHGKTGSWFSDFFGTTKPSQRRLREMAKDIQAMPVGCRDIVPAAQSEAFLKWRSEVIAYNNSTGEESLPGLLSKEALALPLRPDLYSIHFSPNGKYILAQDEGGIHVLTRDPLAPLFFIPAPDAAPASFSTDSNSIAFTSPSLRVETWSVPEQKQTAVHELAMPYACLQTALSPDGSTLACLNTQSDLGLIDVVTGAPLYSKKDFYVSTLWDLLGRLQNGDSELPVTMRFSPDGHYFLAGSHARQLSFDFPSQHLVEFAYDLRAQREISLPRSIRDVMPVAFTFLGPDRILGVNPADPAKSPLLQFPSGERRGEYRLGTTIHLDPVAHGDEVLVHPLPDYPIGLFNLKSKTVLGFKLSALDVYDGIAAIQNIAGEISLLDLANRQTLAHVRLPEARLAPLRSATTSPDLGWLAISTRSRGAIWDLKRNIRTQQIRPFRGAWFGDDEAFYLDINAFDKNPRMLVRIGTKTGAVEERKTLTDIIGGQQGKYLVVIKPKDRKNPLSDADVEVRDVRDDHLIWTRHFAGELPSTRFSGDTLLLTWALSEDSGRAEIAKFPELQKSSDRNDYLCELVNVEANSLAGKLLITINKGSFGVKRLSRTGEWVVAEATGDQVLVYSLATGEKAAHAFGLNPVTSSTGLMALDSGPAYVKLYDVGTCLIRREYEFPTPVAFKQFSADGKQLLVLTTGQVAYFLNVDLHN